VLFIYRRTRRHFSFSNFSKITGFFMPFCHDIDRFLYQTETGQRKTTTTATKDQITKTYKSILTKMIYYNILLLTETLFHSRSYPKLVSFLVILCTANFLDIDGAFAWFTWIGQSERMLERNDVTTVLFWVIRARYTANQSTHSV